MNLILISEIQLLRHRIFGWQGFFVKYFECVIPLHSGLCLKKSLLILLGFPCKWWFVFLLPILIFFTNLLTFSIFTKIYLFVDLLKFILLGVHWGFKIYRLTFFNKFGDFQAIISSDIFSAPFYPGTPIMCMSGL